MTAPADTVTAAYQSQTTAARAQLVAWLTALWAALPDWRNRSMRMFTREALPLVEAAMGHMQDTTAAYLAAVLGAAGGSSTPAAIRSLTVSDVRHGSDPTEVYGRPFHLIWRMLHDGTPPPQAGQAGLDRALQLATTDLQLAKTHTSRQVLANDTRVDGYRRVLEGPHSCALCIVAATRLYHKSELLPMHPACDCSVDPVLKGEHGGGILTDPALLDAVHATVAGQFGADSTAAREIRGLLTSGGNPVLYRDVLIEHQHGELGPVLGVRGESHRGFQPIN